MTTTMTDELVARRRAVEALRSGVPSWDAVALLGSGQPEAEDRFAELLDQIRQPGRPEERPSCGMLLGGGFGAGKSHLLTHLGHLASSSDFVVSIVVISKETRFMTQSRLSGPRLPVPLIQAGSAACSRTQRRAWSRTRRLRGVQPVGELPGERPG